MRYSSQITKVFIVVLFIEKYVESVFTYSSKLIAERKFREIIRTYYKTKREQLYEYTEKQIFIDEDNNFILQLIKQDILKK